MAVPRDSGRAGGVDGGDPVLQLRLAGGLRGAGREETATTRVSGGEPGRSRRALAGASRHPAGTANLAQRADRQKEGAAGQRALRPALAPRGRRQ